MTFKKSSAAMAAMLMSCAVTAPAFAGQAGAYALTILPTLQGESSAQAINNAGQIAGWSYDTSIHSYLYQVAEVPVSHAAFWTASGELTTYGNFSWANGLNDKGQMVGKDVKANYVSFADSEPVSWFGGQRTILGKAGEPLAINNQGVIVGSVRVNPDSFSSPTYAMNWGSGQALQGLGGLSSAANAVNDAGLVAGVSQIELACGTTCSSSALKRAPNHAAVWKDGRVLDLGTLGGAASQAFGLNELGQIVGQAQSKDGVNHAVRWVDGQIQDLGLGRANKINEMGQIVGVSGSKHAMLWQDGAAIDLDALVNDPDWTLSRAMDINDSGTIVGEAISKANGNKRAFVLTTSAVPEPGSSALMLVGVAMVGGIARMRRSARSSRQKSGAEVQG